MHEALIRRLLNDIQYFSKGETHAATLVIHEVISCYKLIFFFFFLVPKRLFIAVGPIKII